MWGGKHTEGREGGTGWGPRDMREQGWGGMGAKGRKMAGILLGSILRGQGWGIDMNEQGWGSGLVYGWA